jgi:nitrate reductase cytochrome c-type subunit
MVHDFGMSVQHWWNDSAKRKRQYSEETPSQPHSVHHTSIGLGPNPGRCHKRSEAAVVFTIRTIIQE